MSEEINEYGLQEGEMAYENLLDLENSLQNNLDEVLKDLAQINLKHEKLQNNEYLENAIQAIIWEQVQNQLAVQIGEDFIRENRNQKLDLRQSAHIQTSDNFQQGKFATHNQDVNYQERYDDWQNNFTINKKGERVLKKDARKFFDEGREKGTAAIHKDHTISIKEQLNDSQLATFFSKEEIKNFANSSKNLHDLDASANMSKGDKTMTDFLNSKRNGKTVEERFNIDVKQLKKDEQEAREAYEKRKTEARESAIQSGKKSRKAETFKITGKALKAAVFQLLSELLREIVSKFIIWLGEKEKNINSFISKIKAVITSFVANLSNHILNVGQSVLTMIATSIIGPVIGSLFKFWSFIQQGWTSLKEAIDYLNNPENKDKSTDIIILEVGKIIVGGLTITGAITLGSLIEGGLIVAFPPLGVEIPLLGSVASIIGVFMGATLSGIAGAFVLKMIDQIIIDKQINQLISKRIDVNNNKLLIQEQLANVTMAITKNEKQTSVKIMGNRHQQAAQEMGKIFSGLFENNEREKKDDFFDIDKLLEDLGN